ncbi:WxL domain-containing protein [Enterococcus entomosocium]|uniref:WxL domain-containing protein n=1 Tax=Enterococcus entomosocium TaxID=3034352 RepID=UPI003B5B8C18
MTTRLRRPLLLLGASILMMQALILSIGIVYAETTMDTEDQKQVEHPPMKNLLEEEQASDARFFFTQARMQGTVEETIQITFFSDQEVSEARVFLPEEATLLKDKLPTRISVEEGEQPNEWIVQSKRAQNTFFLPLVFEKEGNYEISVEEAKAQLEISEYKENNDENLSSADINHTQGTDIITEHSLTNLLVNPNILFNRGVETTIPHWELASSTTPVNVLSRNLSISQATDVNGWNRLSDSDFQIGTNWALQVNRTSGTRTLMVNQTIQTVQGHTYDVQVNARRNSSTGNLAITAYNGNGVIAGPNGLSSQTYSLDSDFQTYGIRFTANSNQTTIGFRVDGANIIFNQTSVTPTQYSLKLESLPSVGGNGQAEMDLLTQGQTTAIVATPNPGYRFVHWQTSNGNNAVIGDPTATNTSITMGNSDVTLQAIFEKEGRVFVDHIDSEGNKLADSEELSGSLGENYETSALEIENYQLTEQPKNAKGIFTEEDINVTYIYDVFQVNPVDPLNPEVEVEPENKPELPEDQGLFSIDFASRFDFGVQTISAKDQTYYAKPQRLLNEEGTVMEEVRPNYVQISDRRPAQERDGWELSVRQNEKFTDRETGEVLTGARLILQNQQITTAQSGTAPDLAHIKPITLNPEGAKSTLLKAQGSEGEGTWIYRFGDAESADKSVVLELPRGATPRATSYKTTLTWELSSVPDN